MFAKRIGDCVRKPLGILSVKHALIKRFVHKTRQPLSLDLKDIEQPFYRGINIKLEEGLLEDPAIAKQLLCPPLISEHGAYHEAVIASCKDFMDRVVLNVGAASEILSLCAAEAGARHVYTVEADFLRAKVVRQLVATKPTLAKRITIIDGKIEEIELPEKADILISEAVGTLLVCKESLKDYAIARDRFLNPSGKSFPSIGRIQMAPFTDAHLFNKIADRPVFNLFDPNVLVAGEVSHMINFTTIKEGDIPEIDIPLKFTACLDAIVHGLTFCFDVYFGGSTVTKWLTTTHESPSPFSQHVQCLLSKPINVMSGQEITGRLHFVGDAAHDYTIYLTMSAEQGGDLYTSSAKFDLNDAWDMTFAKDGPPDSWYQSDSEGEPTDYLVNTQEQ